MLERRAFRGGPTRLERSMGDADRHHHLIDQAPRRFPEFRSDEIEDCRRKLRTHSAADLSGRRLELYADAIRPDRRRTA
jgi:Fe2+ or Zn2+ uptake regulation protein